MKLVLSLLCLFLSGCVSSERIMTNSSGQKIRCYAVGGGVIGVITATSTFDDCVEKLTARGYK